MLVYAANFVASVKQPVKKLLEWYLIQVCCLVTTNKYNIHTHAIIVIYYTRHDSMSPTRENAGLSGVCNMYVSIIYIPCSAKFVRS